MAKKRQKKNKKNHFVRKTFALAIGVAIIIAACIQQQATGKKLPLQVEEIVKQAQVLVNQACEEISDIQRTSEQQSGTDSPTMDYPTEAGIEIPALRSNDTRILKRLGYTLSYNDEWKTPNWVAWYLTPERMEGKVKRTNHFETDPDLPEKTRSEHRDYSGSRYDRGHMAPAGDMKWDEQAMKESFYMSNMCPQASNLNKGDWRVLEELCRQWTQHHQTPLYIVCGPIMTKERHKRIGNNRVAVPDKFFKVVLKLGQQPASVGFIFPNDDCNEPLESYSVSVDSVEAITGIDFFYQLPDDKENELEAINGMKKF